MFTQEGVDGGSASGWQRIRRARAHELVLEQIEERIRDGRLQRGDRLPGERQLSELLGVSRPSVREALRSLEALGILSERVIEGPESSSVLAREPSGALASMLRLHIELSNFSEFEVVQVRLMVEEYAVREAALKATDQEIDSLRMVLDHMDRSTLNILEFNALDSAFHEQIALACGNRLVGHLVGALRNAVERHRLAAMRARGDWVDVARALTTEHREIVEALAAGDADGAAGALRHHLERTFPVVRTVSSDNRPT